MATRRKPPVAAWKPGQSGNPKGRPAGTGEVAKIRAAIALQLPDLLERLMAQAQAVLQFRRHSKRCGRV